jgi:hypothetical protein
MTATAIEVPTVSNTNAPVQKRRGRKPKPDKRVPLSVLLDPSLHRVLVDTAQKEGRSVTGQTERLLKQGVTIIYGHSHNGGTDVIDVLLVKRTDVDNNIGDQANSIIGRAALFLEAKYTGRGKDERIARDLGISSGMAKLLRRGRAWTVARLNQGMELWPEFRAFVFRAPRDQLADQLEHLAAGLTRLANELAALRRDLGGTHHIGVSS